MRIACLALAGLAACQVPPPAEIQTSPGSVTTRPFPEAWTGRWVGTLEIEAVEGRLNYYTVAMELHIEPLPDTETMRWKIIYGEGAKRQVRDYVLKTVDVATDRYAIDEKNGIILPAYWLNGLLSTRFQVQDSLLLSTYRRVCVNLRFTILAGRVEGSDAGG